MQGRHYLRVGFDGWTLGIVILLHAPCHTVGSRWTVSFATCNEYNVLPYMGRGLVVVMESK